MLATLTDQLRRGVSLSAAQVTDAIERLIEEEAPVALKAEFLFALAHKGETIEEISTFARVLRDKAVQPVLDPETRSREIIDVVGVGGDRLGTFNISTTAAIVVAAGGVTVAKHGNRAVTSQTGSADVIEALGIPIDLSPVQAARALQERHFAFFFAPRYHPAFKHIAPARKLCAEQGQRTVFNYLGPLLNPVKPSAMLMGVPNPESCEVMARVLQSLGVRRAMVVCGTVSSTGSEESGGSETARKHVDELTTLGSNFIAEFYHERGFSTSTLATENFDARPATLADLIGGGREQNAEITRRILRGDDRSPRRDVVLLNAGAALFLAGKAKSLAEGWDLAAQLIDGGTAAAKLAELARPV